MSEKLSFGVWLDTQMSMRKMRPIDLEKATGLHSGVISNLRRNKRNAGLDTCRKIADALDMPLEEVYRAAGHLDADGQDGHSGKVIPFNPIIHAIISLVSRLPDNEKQDVEEYARLRLRRNKKRSATGEGSRLS